MLRFGSAGGRAAVLLCLVVLLSHVRVGAQATSGVLGGTVYDPEHAVLPGARVDAVNNATHQEFIGYSDRSGNYTLNSMPTGTYSVDITASAFTAATATQVVIEK